MTRLRRTGPAVVLALLVGSVLAGCGAEGTGDKGYIAGDGVIRQVPAGHRDAVGTVTGTTLHGDQIDLADLRGKVVVVNVWGSWCPPCRAEASTLVAAAKELAPEGVKFVGINTRDLSKDNPLAFERRYGVTYPSIYDPSGKTLLAFRGTITPSSIPSTIVVDARGRVAASVLGEVPSRTTLVELVHDAAGTKASS